MLTGCERDPSASEQREVERKAVAAAQANELVQLVGTPTAVKSRRMSIDELQRRRSRRTPDCRASEAAVWVVVLTGAVSAQPPPSAGSGSNGGEPTDEPAMWLVLEPSGEVRQFGAGPMDLDAAPPPASATACAAGR